MRKRIIIGVLLVFVLVIGWLIYPEVFNNEPKYHGKRLSFWFKQYYRSGWPVLLPDPAEWNESMLAFQAMGTNAVPWLVERAFEVTPDPTWRVKIHEFLSQKFNYPYYVSADDISMCAVGAVELIRPPADLLLPLVTNRLTDPNPDVRYAALRLLGAVGDHKEAAVPWLRDHLQDTNLCARAAAVSLSELGEISAPAVPELTKYLRVSSSAGEPSISSLFAVAAIGAPASNAIPLLKQLLSTVTNNNSQLFIAAALYQIDNGQTQALDLIIDQIQNRPQVNPYGAFACLHLLRMNPNAGRAIPVLRQCFNDSDPGIWLTAANTLRLMGETNLVLDILTEKMTLANPTDRVEAASIALRWAPNHTLSISNLMTLVYEPTVTADAAARLVECVPFHRWLSPSCKKSRCKKETHRAKAPSKRWSSCMTNRKSNGRSVDLQG